MDVIKIFISYLLGLICAHIFLYCGSMVIMILLMVFGLDEKMSALIYIYVSGGLATYLFYYIFTRKRVGKLFLYCWLFVGIMVCSFYNHGINDVLYNFMYNHFMKSVHDSYYSIYGFQDAFTLILVYVLCQLSALLLYFMVRLGSRPWEKFFSE